MVGEYNRWYLETERLFLRELSILDEEIIYKLDGDPEVMKYLTDGEPSSLSDVRKKLKKIEELFKKHEGAFGVWAAHLKESNEFIGWFHFRPSESEPNNVKKIELGYRFFKNFWGNGFATEGSRALIKKGFNNLDVEEVFAVTMEHNISSQKVMERVGLQFVRKFISPEFPNSKEFDVEYAISKEKWLKN